MGGRVCHWVGGKVIRWWEGGERVVSGRVVRGWGWEGGEKVVSGRVVSGWWEDGEWEGGAEEVVVLIRL